MKTELAEQQILLYQEDGFLVVEDFLTKDELEFWRNAVTGAIQERNGKKSARQ